MGSNLEEKPNLIMKLRRGSHKRQAASIKGAQRIVSEASDHGIPWRQPDLFVSPVAEVVRPANGFKG